MKERRSGGSIYSATSDTRARIFLRSLKSIFGWWRGDDGVHHCNNANDEIQLLRNIVVIQEEKFKRRRRRGGEKFLRVKIYIYKILYIIYTKLYLKLKNIYIIYRVFRHLGADCTPKSNEKKSRINICPICFTL